MQLVERVERTAYLGSEFLTWLWYRSELQEGLFRLDEGDDEANVEVWFDARLTLEALGTIKEQNVIKSESPTETDEARASLQSGKHVTEARLRLLRDQKQWTVTVKAESLALHGLKIPALLTREEDDKIYERLSLLEEAEDILDALFGIFARLRLDDDSWSEEVRAVREWAGRRV